MSQTLAQEIIHAERALQRLKDKQRAQIYEMPRIQNKANELVKYGYSDTYIQSKLYAMRTANIGIDDIVNCIEIAKQSVTPVKN